MPKLRIPPNCIVVSDQHRGECITIMGVEAHGDGFVDRLRKQITAGRSDADKTDPKPSVS